MANFYTDNDDLRFYVEQAIDWTTLAGLAENDFTAPDGFENAEDAVAFYQDVIEMVGRFIAEEIAPFEKQLDAEHPRVEDGEVISGPTMNLIMDKIKALELHGLSLPRELGGMNGPLLAYMLNSEMFARADVSLAAHHGFHAGIAMALFVYAIEEGSVEVDDNGAITDIRFREAIEEIVRGDAWGAMDITEPDAGSDMAALRCKGEQDEDGNWFVSGQKIFITSGHGKHHVVIAKTDDRNELDALSLFLVKTFEDDADGNRTRFASIDRVEEKIGHHPSATCAITFDRSPAELIGEIGDGFKGMLLLMNNARIGVGFECIGMIESAIRQVHDYAAERRTFGKSIDQHEMIADYIQEMETDVCAIRALAVNAAINEETAYRAKLRLTLDPKLDPLKRKRLEKDAKKYRAKARRLTPLLKYYAGEKVVEISRRAIQIHGGSGFTTEYGVEKILRDSLVMPIYEGTSQIQSLMAMKDTLGAIFKNPQAFIKDIATTRWQSLSARDPRQKKLARVRLLALQAQQHLIRKTAFDKIKGVKDRPVSEWMESLSDSWDPKRDFAYAMLHAERLTQILVDVAVLEILLEQAEQFPERGILFDRFAERSEPRCKYYYDIITTTGDGIIEQLHGPEHAAAQ